MLRRQGRRQRFRVAHREKVTRIIASLLSRSQDLAAVLMVLYAAIRPPPPRRKRAARRKRR